MGKEIPIDLEMLQKFTRGGGLPKAQDGDELVKIEVADVRNWNSNTLDIMQNPSEYSKEDYIQAVSKIANTFGTADKILFGEKDTRGVPGYSTYEAAGKDYVDPITGEPAFEKVYKLGGAFEPHMMYDPRTKESYNANQKEDHLRMAEMGYLHQDEMYQKGGEVQVDNQTLAALIAAGADIEIL
jgi:hypothetical protein